MIATASSRFSAGDLVQVRPIGEILRTLDSRGTCEGVPFMPEMLAYCGQFFRVAKRAHKTCDFAQGTGLRALQRTVHLASVRCSGCHHGGCEARCLIFWKDAWLRLPAEPSAAETGDGCSVGQLIASAYAPGTGPGQDPVTYSCQATRLPEFTRSLSAWDLRVYLEDYASGNVSSLGDFLSRAAYRAYDNLVNLGFGLGRPLRAIYNMTLRLAGSRTLYPAMPGRVARGATTPSAQLDLRPGEYVRVKDHAAILATLDASNRNRGLSFSAEMTPFCGRLLRVLARVERIVDERTGRLLQMRHPCVILEGATCGARYNRHLIFCPRDTYAYWREIWLERVAPAAATPAAPTFATAATAAPDLPFLCPANLQPPHSP